VKIAGIADIGARGNWHDRRYLPQDRPTSRVIGKTKPTTEARRHREHQGIGHRRSACAHKIADITRDPRIEGITAETRRRTGSESVEGRNTGKSACAT